jgi:hypothetical protein
MRRIVGSKEAVPQGSRGITFRGLSTLGNLCPSGGSH